MKAAGGLEGLPRCRDLAGWKLGPRSFWRKDGTRPSHRPFDTLRAPSLSRIGFPDAPDLRPTPDRVRETLFNWLGQDLAGLACLDLFAGSGALGLEAASRGAARVVLVEPEPRRRLVG